MVGLKSLRTRLIARVRALLYGDWRADAGEQFRKTTQKISDFAEEHHIKPGDLAGKSIELGIHKVDGLANKEYAAALRDFAPAEDQKIDTKLKRRSLESKVREGQADAHAAEAKARLEELNVVNAEFELYAKPKQAGVVLHRDARGNLTVLAASGCDLIRLTDPQRRPDVDENSQRADGSEPATTG